MRLYQTHSKPTNTVQSTRGIMLPAVPVFQKHAARLLSDKPEDGKMVKDDFLSMLELQVHGAANEVLNKYDQSAADCPYITKWFGLYAGRDASQLEKALSRFAPSASDAITIEQLITIVAEQIRSALTQHMATNSFEDVPEEVKDAAPSPLPAVAQLCSSTAADPPPPAAEKKQPLAKAKDLEENPGRGPGKVTLGQGTGQKVMVGDEVDNINTHSCALVVAFGERGIYAFHWPSLNDKGADLVNFKDDVENKIGKANQVEILARQPSKVDLDGYIKSAAAIAESVGASHRLRFNTHPNIDLIIASIEAATITPKPGTGTFVVV